jgi:hypothetical protein
MGFHLGCPQLMPFRGREQMGVYVMRELGQIQVGEVHSRQQDHVVVDECIAGQNGGIPLPAASWGCHQSNSDPSLPPEP